MSDFKTYNAIDISSYFIKKNVSPLKLQKLLYYSQVWYFVKNRKPLFNDQISAWIFGPVVYNVWSTFRFIKRTDLIPQNKALNINLDNVINHLEDVWNAYGHLNGSQLVEQTHKDKPWLISRDGLLNEQPSDKEVIIDINTVSDFKLCVDNTIPKILINDKSFGHFSSF